ncbi:hypothetical protein EVAR_90977_1 [Eumeta japonica]|uniref:Little elongation complex subunit 2 C-terminal domain-containing protein n=1 Tax=Eumeta variegata TaxID=151549 RepID=A0A4C1Z4U4_EUMVA|nr:hypothetical protein EVAR_90977_1 [Eumeta japonica]
MRRQRYPAFLVPHRFARKCSTSKIRITRRSAPLLPQCIITRVCYAYSSMVLRLRACIRVFMSRAYTLTTSSLLTSYFRHEQYGDKEAELALAEGLWAFHTIPTAAVTLKEDSLLEEVSYVANCVNNDVLKRWEKMKTSTNQRWIEVFKNFKDSGIPFQNCLAIVQYLLCLPETNAPTERVFSLTNSLWTSEKCYFEKDSEHFVTEQGLDNSVIEKILSNKFKDPLLSSSESEDESNTPKFNWDKILGNNTNGNKSSNIFTPGMKPLPAYPKLSTLTKQQHYKCLKILAAEHPLVNENNRYPRPTRGDHKTFAQIKPVYEAEQQEYIQWAKKMWSTDHCIRALRPRPPVESVYDAEFNFRANMLKSMIKHYEFAAQIPFESLDNQFSLIHQKNLITVNTSQLPVVKSITLKSKYTILRHNPKCQNICEKHPCYFVSPSEKVTSTLSLMELNEGLAEYAAVNGAQFIISEDALKCLVEHKRSWFLPVNVHEGLNLDNSCNTVVVIGDEFSLHKEPATVRTYTAFKHMLHQALVVPQESLKQIEGSHINTSEVKSSAVSTRNKDFMDTYSDEEENLVIDFELEEGNAKLNSEQKGISFPKKEPTTLKSRLNNGSNQCSCKEQPPPRSYTKWEVRNRSTNEKISIIVHCAHKAKNNESEVILEPIPEYQLDLGGSILPPDKIRSLALSLYLRRNATLLTVRLDGQTGDIVTYDYADLQELEDKHENSLISGAANVIYSTLNHLQGLLPGNYVLQHETQHGPNGLLYTARSYHTGTQSLSLEVSNTQLSDETEAQYLKTPTALGPVLLPYHKTRKILPLAFSPFPNHIAKQPRKFMNKPKIPPPVFQFASETTGSSSLPVTEKKPNRYLRHLDIQGCSRGRDRGLREHTQVALRQFEPPYSAHAAHRGWPICWLARHRGRRRCAIYCVHRTVTLDNRLCSSLKHFWCIVCDEECDRTVWERYYIATEYSVANTWTTSPKSSLRRASRAPRTISVDAMSVSFKTREVVDRLGCIKASEVHEFVVYEDRGENLNYFLQRDLTNTVNIVGTWGHPITNEGLSGSKRLQQRTTENKKSGVDRQQAESSRTKLRV